MNIEFEGRILEINHDEMVRKLEAAGAKKIFEAMQRRYVYDFHPVHPNKWIRLRTNGKKTTLTIKDLQAKTIDGTKELEIEVDDFEKTNEILEQLGYQNRGYQENRRCQYMLDGVEVDLDLWPGIPEYMEVEGRCEEDVYATLEKLGYAKENVVTLDVSSIYSYYGFDGDNLGNLRFEEDQKCQSLKN